LITDRLDGGALGNHGASLKRYGKPTKNNEEPGESIWERLALAAMENPRLFENH